MLQAVTKMRISLLAGVLLLWLFGTGGAHAQSFADLQGPRSEPRDDSMGFASSTEHYICGAHRPALLFGGELAAQGGSGGLSVTPSLSARGVFQLTGEDGRIGTSLGLGLKVAPVVADGVKVKDIVDALKHAEGGDISFFLNVPIRYCGPDVSFALLPAVYVNNHSSDFGNLEDSFTSVAASGRFAFIVHEPFGGVTSFALSATMLHYFPFGSEDSLKPLRDELGDGVGLRISFSTIIAKLLKSFDLQVEAVWAPLRTAGSFELRTALSGAIF